MNRKLFRGRYEYDGRMPKKSEERPPRPRIEGLADLVFGLSLSLGALSLVVSPPSSISEIDSHILVFVFAFLILITIWINYTASMSVLPIENEASHGAQCHNAAFGRACSFPVECRRAL